MTELMRRYLLSCLLPAGFLCGQDYVRVPSQADGRTYVIDTTKVGDDLKPVTAPESKLSAFLFPQPGATPTEAHYNVERRIASATFRTGGSVEQVTEYYVQTLGAQGLKVSKPLQVARGGAQLTGFNSTKTISVYVDPKPGFIEIRATEAITKQPIKQKHFESVWYDDTRGILRLKDTATGDEYDLPKKAIVAHNLNRPGAVKSEKAAMPDWLPAYPGAKWLPIGKISFMMDPTAAFVTSHSIRQVYDYYRAAIEGAGANITSQELTRSGTPMADFSAHIVALRGDDGVEIQIGEAIQIGSILAATGPKQIGIGIRYTVPKP